ncbi:MAG: hypothetical protein IPG29_13905 [Sphingobacteriales bacterium]|nr:hypothetical protein [Sphingobacteriales bacterium]
MPRQMPGTNGSTTACNDQVAPLDLFALLGGTPQTGGNWTNNNGASNFNAALGNWTVLNHAAEHIPSPTQ